MINFEIDINEVYESLCRPRIEHDELREEINRRFNDLDLKTKSTIQYSKIHLGKISLPEPLKEIDIVFNSNGINYSGEVNFNYESCSDSSELIKEVSKKNKDKEGVLGLEKKIIFMNENIPLFCYKSDFPYTKLIFGKDGTSKRLLNNKEEFEADILKFKNILTQVVNSHYDDNIIDIRYQLFTNN